MLDAAEKITDPDYRNKIESVSLTYCDQLSEKDGSRKMLGRLPVWRRQTGFSGRLSDNSPGYWCSLPLRNSLMFFHKDRNLPSSLPPTSIFTMAVELFPDGATLMNQCV
jgi:hypothetical protein